MLYVDVHHKVLKTVEIQGNKEKEGTYASISTIKSRSATIEKMNLGRILPYVHFQGEDGNLREYSIPTDPSADPAEWILSAADDEDLGEEAWMCIDDPETGLTHGLVFESNNGLVNNPEEDGVQVKTSVHQHVKLPGLEADSGDLIAVRNAYEAGRHDTTLRGGLEVSFSVEFITLRSGGYKSIEKEAAIYKQLVAIQPPLRKSDVTRVEEEEGYRLTVYVHMAPSFPLGSMLSAATGRNLTYLTVELYRENEFISSGSPSRLHLGAMGDINENLSLKEKVSKTLGFFDIRNSSFFKSIHFPDVKPGRYLIKVYKENPVVGRERRFIGFKIVNLTGDTKIHVFCKVETVFKGRVVDQNSEAVPGVLFYLKYSDVVISSSETDKNGSVEIPIPLGKYRLQVLYKGFLLGEEDVKLEFKHHFKVLYREFKVGLYNLSINIRDTWGLPLEVNVNPIATSEEMVDKENIKAKEDGKGVYILDNLPAAKYRLKMSYKSFNLEETVDVIRDSIIDIDFPAEFPINVRIWNSMGLPLEKGRLILLRGDKKTSIGVADGEAETSIPPGEYKLRVVVDDETVAYQGFSVLGKQDLSLVTKASSPLHSLILLLGYMFASAAILIGIWRRQVYKVISLLIVGLIIISLSQPWWGVSGENVNVSTSTKTTLIPPKIITLTTSGEVIGGEIASIPEELTMVLKLVTLLLILVIVMVMLSIFTLSRYDKLSLILYILGFLVGLITMGIFLFAMGVVTEVGVGSISGGGELPVSIPGGETISLTCIWGLEKGFYIALIACILPTIYIGRWMWNRFKK